MGHIRCETQSLPFDFYLPIENILIEYQGLEHYEAIKFFGGEDKFKQRKINDNIKKEYCLKSNIKLIEIPYWKFDEIENVLEVELNE